jgi:cytochrome c biogenesis protein
MSGAKRIYRFLSSMKTGLVLLGLIGVMSAIGSGVMPDIFFQTPLFKLPLLLLFLNMALCTANQVAGYLNRRLTGRGKNRTWFRQVGILLLHAGVVLILVGGAVNSTQGQTDRISIVEGDIVDVAGLLRTAEPFSLKLDKFAIEFNPDGSPSQYRSYVTVLAGDKEAKAYNISVNHPLKYGGVKAYQESFGYLVNVEVADGTGEKQEKTLPEGEFLALSGTERTVRVYRYIPNFDPEYGMNTRTLRPDNPRIIYSVSEPGKLLGVGAAAFGERVEIDDNIYVKFNGVQPYTVLKLKSDPGLPLAGAGGLMLMTGVCLALIFSPGRKPQKQPVEQPVAGESDAEGPGDATEGLSPAGLSEVKTEQEDA